jgi:hypothetical protein
MVTIFPVVALASRRIASRANVRSGVWIDTEKSTSVTMDKPELWSSAARRLGTI